MDEIDEDARLYAGRLIEDLSESTHSLRSLRDDADERDSTEPLYSAIARLSISKSILHQMTFNRITSGQRAISDNVLEAIEMLEKSGGEFTPVCRHLSSMIGNLFQHGLAIEGYNLTRASHIDRVQRRN